MVFLVPPDAFGMPGGGLPRCPPPLPHALTPGTLRPVQVSVDVTVPVNDSSGPYMPLTDGTCLRSCCRPRRRAVGSGPGRPRGMHTGRRAPGLSPGIPGAVLTQPPGYGSRMRACVHRAPAASAVVRFLCGSGSCGLAWGNCRKPRRRSEIVVRVRACMDRVDVVLRRSNGRCGGTEVTR